MFSPRSFCCFASASMPRAGLVLSLAVHFPSAASLFLASNCLSATAGHLNPCGLLVFLHWPVVRSTALLCPLRSFRSLLAAPSGNSLASR